VNEKDPLRLRASWKRDNYKEELRRAVEVDGWKLKGTEGGKEGRRGQLELASPPSVATSPPIHQYPQARSLRIRTRGLEELMRPMMIAEERKSLV